MIDKVKEDLFYKGEFNFSYSSLNRLLFSPKLFYKDYILKERETKMDKHLIEGKLIHLLLLEPDRFDEEFVMSPLKMPTDSVKKILRNVNNKIVDPNNYMKLKDLDDQILEALKEENLYQSFKEDQKRLDKIITEESETYFKFLQTTGKTIIDADTFARCMDRVVIIRANDDVTKLLMQEATDFEMDTIQVYNEKKLECKLNDYKFGLKGIIDKYIIDDEAKTITIVDLKTTGSNPSDINIYRMRDFGYDTQCYLYKELFGMDFKFIFFGKKQKVNESGEIYYDIEEITPSDQTIESGKMAVMNALANYDKFFGEGATHDVRKSYTRRVI